MAVDSPGYCSEAGGSVLFATRIEPLMSESRPSSCNGCHARGLDLDDFVRGTACQSMACLVHREMVDFAEPDKSKLLELMVRGAVEGDAATRRAALIEHEAFAEWIRYSAVCHQSVCGPIEDPCGAPRRDAGLADAAVPDVGGPDFGGPDGAMPDAEDPPDLGADAGAGPGDAAVDTGPDAAPEPCSPDALRFEFVERVWRWRGRCYHCHQGDGEELGPSDAPTWMARGTDVGSAHTTYFRVLQRGYLDLEAPDESLLLLKPLAENAGGVEHRGGIKFRSLEDPAYLDFRDWIWTYARCQDPELPGGP